MSIIETNRFDAHAERRLQARLGQAGIKPGTLIPGGLGGLLDAAYDVQNSSGDATSKDFAGLLLAIDEAMTDIEAAKPVDPLDVPRPVRRSIELRLRSRPIRPRSAADTDDVVDGLV